MRELTAPISNIQRFSVHDGPGIRTVVFFMGCPLRCRWCQNPEMRNINTRLMYLREKCIGCKACIAVCPTGANRIAADGLIDLDWDKCIGCGACVEVCMPGARIMVSYEKTVTEVEEAVLSDYVFYKQSGGGVTLSGGEVTTHADFAAELFDRLHKRGIHTAIETSGYCKPEAFLKLMERTDLLLFDVKHTEEQMHRKYTDVGTHLIQGNLMLAAEKNKDIIIRIPLIPGFNDGEENMRATARIAKQVKAQEIHILPFHQAGESKWRDSGIAYTMSGEKPPTADVIDRCKEILETSGLPVNVGGHGFYGLVDV